MNHQWWSPKKVSTSNCSCSKDTSRAFPQYEFSCAPWDARTWRKFCRNLGTCKKKFSFFRTLAKEEEEWILGRSSVQPLEVSSHLLLFSARCPCLNNRPSVLEWFIFLLWGFSLCQGPPLRDLPKVLAQDQTITAKIRDFSCNRQISSQTVNTGANFVCFSHTTSLNSVLSALLSSTSWLGPSSSFSRNNCLLADSSPIALLVSNSHEFLNKIIWDEYSTGDQTIILGQ